MIMYDIEAEIIANRCCKWVLEIFTRFEDLKSYGNELNWEEFKTRIIDD